MYVPPGTIPEILRTKRPDEVKTMTQEVMKIVDERTGEMKCSVCRAVHVVGREDGRHYPPESLWCIHGCRLEDTE